MKLVSNGRRNNGLPPGCYSTLQSVLHEMNYKYGNIVIHCLLD